jgi:hypothetical protein
MLIEQKLHGKVLPAYFHFGIKEIHLAKVYVLGIGSGNIVAYLDAKNNVCRGSKEWFLPLDNSGPEL